MDLRRLLACGSVLKIPDEAACLRMTQASWFASVAAAVCICTVKPLYFEFLGTSSIGSNREGFELEGIKFN